MVKWPRGPFIFKGHGTKECLKLGHTHTYEPFCVYIWKVWLFDHFIDKYSRFGYVDRKFDALDKLIEFKAKSDNLLSKHIKTLQLNWGGLSSRFNPFHMEHEMISQLWAPRIPLQNGVMERRYWALIDKVRSEIGFSLLPIFFGHMS